MTPLHARWYKNICGLFRVPGTATDPLLQAKRPTSERGTHSREPPQSAGARENLCLLLAAVTSTYVMENASYRMPLGYPPWTIDLTIAQRRELLTTDRKHDGRQGVK